MVLEYMPIRSFAVNIRSIRLKMCIRDRCYLDHFHHTDHQHKAGGLDHAGNQVDGQRDQASHRLRNDDVPVGCLLYTSADGGSG